MKKTIILIIMIIFSLLLIGCENSSDNNKKLNISFEVSEIIVYKESTLSYESEYMNCFVNEKNEVSNFINSLKTIEYIEKETKSKIDITEFPYVVKLKDNYSILILEDDSFIIYTNGFYKICEKTKGDFNFVKNINFGNKLQEFIVNITKEDLELIALKYNEIDINLSSNHYIKELILNTKYYENTNNNENINLLYEFNFSNDKTLYIFDNGTVSFTDGDKVYSNAYMIVNKEFDVLKNITEGDVVQFNEKEDTNKVVVKNFEDLSANVKQEDIKTFIENLNTIKYIKAKDFTQYTIGDFKYKIEINGQTIGVYNNDLIIIGDTLYNVVEGNFDFLKDVEFNTSSGWLPWI